MAATSNPVPIESNEWSEESGSEDDLLLEIITQGKPTSRQPAMQPVKSSKPPTTEAVAAQPVFRPHVPKSASVQEFSQPSLSSSIPPSQSVDSSLSKGNVRDVMGSDVEDDDDDDDDEMLYACIRSAKPTAKPVPPPRTSSISSKSTPSVQPPAPPSNGVHKSRASRPPMELPKSTSASSKEVNSYSLIILKLLQCFNLFFVIISREYLLFTARFPTSDKWRYVSKARPKSPDRVVDVLDIRAKARAGWEPAGVAITRA